MPRPRLDDAQQSCSYCSQQAERLCDYMIGRMVFTQQPVTCDRPLCGDHATQTGTLFFCGKPPVRGVETIDYCPQHANARKFPQHGNLRRVFLTTQAVEAAHAPRTP